jgi:hypothetical protein
MSSLGEIVKKLDSEFCRLCGGSLPQVGSILTDDDTWRGWSRLLYRVEVIRGRDSITLQQVRQRP